MELSAKQQTTELIKNSKKILLVSHINPDGDSVGSTLALFSVLESLGKEVSMVCSDSISPNLNYLQGIGEIGKELEGVRDFVVKLNVKDKPVEKLSYNVKDDILNIVLSSKAGTYDVSDITFGKGSYKYDLVIALDTADVDNIDKIYDENTELFLETPVVNIDHHAGNEHFGTVNFVDLTATSTAEILVSLIESLNVKLDEEVATCLLTGIIYDTGSFKNQGTTPKSLTVSAQLLAAGARQQEIIKNLYKTKPLNALKLWGKVLSRLEQDEEYGFAYSIVTHDDIVEYRATKEDIRSIVEDLKNSTPGADVVLLLCEYEPNIVEGKLYGQRGTDVLALAELFGGSGDFQAASFDMENVTMEEATEEVVEKIRALRRQHLGLQKPDERKKAFGNIQKIDKSNGEHIEPSEGNITLISKDDESAEVYKFDEVREALEIEKNENVQTENEAAVEKDKEKAVEELRRISEEHTLEAPLGGPSDAITSALDSLEKERSEREEAEVDLKVEEVGNGMTSIKDVLKDKFNRNKPLGSDVFKDDEDEDIVNSIGEIVHEDTDEGDIRVWKSGN